MCMVITGVGFLIHIYSVGYMAEDPDFARYFAYLNLFTAMMLILVLADSLPLMFVGWEGVGLCSYLLIGFWYTDPDKASAGKKAFIVNRIGDAGFLLGAFALYWGLVEVGVPSLRFEAINAYAGSLPTGLVTASALLLFIGAAGKSAQIPLYVWLPDAMAGPTPVSALIHAATMVTAGVYMVARLNGLYLHAPLALEVIAFVGAATAIVAATIAVAQNDIKKVLAYSTVSQLGYMFLALGVGAFTAAIFHVMTHAFFKALLFLGAGSVIHAVHDEQDIRRMGGLREAMPLTFATFLAATLAIAGVPGFSGFFSKDEILASVFDSGHVGLWVVGVVGAGLTAFYMTRLVTLTFYGSFRGDAETGAHLHESPRIMTTPLVVLAFLAVVGGWVGIPHVLGGWIGIPNFFAEFLEPVLGHHSLHLGVGTELGLMAASVAVAGVGIVVGFSLYQNGPATDGVLQARLGRVYGWMGSAYSVDQFYHRLFVRPVIVVGGWLWRYVDEILIDGMADGGAASVLNVGDWWRRWTSGNVQHYMLSILVGAALMVVVLTLWGGQ